MSSKLFPPNARLINSHEGEMVNKKFKRAISQKKTARSYILNENSFLNAKISCVCHFSFETSQLSCSTLTSLVAPDKVSTLRLYRCAELHNYRFENISLIIVSQNVQRILLINFNFKQLKKSWLLDMKSSQFFLCF